MVRSTWIGSTLLHVCLDPNGLRSRLVLAELPKALIWDRTLPHFHIRQFQAAVVAHDVGIQQPRKCRSQNLGDSRWLLQS
jgi:hypothetical protein